MEPTLLKRAEELLKQEFGFRWKEIVQTLGTMELTSCAGKDLTSFMAFPERAQGGNHMWRGNCAPQVVQKILSFVLECLPRRKKEDFLFLDPMCGSGTSKDVADKMGISCIQYDLNPNLRQGKGGWNALKDEVEDRADLVFLHPPYHSIIRYSGEMWGSAHPDDLSRCESYWEFIEKLNFVVRKMFLSLRNGGFLAVLVGDIRQNGIFHSIADDIMTIGQMKSWIVKGQFHCKSARKQYTGRYPFIPITTEHLLLFQKENSIQIPFSYRKHGTFCVLEQDSNAMTWYVLICTVMEEQGGNATFQELYEALADHPKARGKRHYRERIRGCVYEHRASFQKDSHGRYYLTYR